METKICKKCGIEDVIENFRKDGFKCKSCARVDSKKWRDNNKERHKKSSREWYHKNKERAIKVRKEYILKNPHIPKRCRENYRNTYAGKLHHVCSTLMLRVLHGSKDKQHWEDLVGYSVEDLIKHLESQFKEGMAWDNYGIGGWEVDHKIPRSAFNYERPNDIDFKKCWELSNLQPLWFWENRSKNKKLKDPFQPSLLLEAVW